MLEIKNTISDTELIDRLRAHDWTGSGLMAMAADRIEALTGETEPSASGPDTAVKPEKTLNGKRSSWHCGICGKKSRLMRYDRYCSVCGTKIDWRDTDGTAEESNPAV